MAALVFATACQPAVSPPAPAAELLGYRMLWRVDAGRRDAGPANTGMRPWFDSERMPSVRITGVPLDDWGLSAVDGTGRAVAAMVSRRPVAGGGLIGLDTPTEAPAQGAGTVALLRLADGAVVRSWLVMWAAPPDSLVALRSVIEARVAGRGDVALARLDAFDARGSTSELRLWAGVERARAYNQLGRIDESLAAWLAAADDALSLGAPTEATRRWRAAAYQHIWRREFSRAEALLERAWRLDARHDHRAGLLLADYYRALIAGELGDFRRGVGLYRRALASAEAIGADANRRLIALSFANLLQNQGQHREALERLDRLAPAYAAPAIRGTRGEADYLAVVGWVRLRAMLVGAVPWRPADAGEPFDGALAIYTSTAREPTSARNMRANRAWLALVDGRADDAAREIEAARAIEISGPGFESRFLELLTAEVALARGDAAAALSLLERAVVSIRIETGGVDSDLMWRALHRRGRAHLALGRADAALTDWRAALRSMDRVAGRTGLREARAGYFSDRDELVADTLALLVARGRDAEAFEIAEAARARVLRALEADVRLERLSPAQREMWADRVAGWLDRRSQFERSASEVDLLLVDEQAVWRARRSQSADALRGTFDELVAWLDEAAPGAAPAAPTAAEVALALRPDEALAAWVRVGDRWRIFFVTAAGVSGAWVDESAPLGPWKAQIAELGHLYLVPGGFDAARELPLNDGTGFSFSALPHAGFVTKIPASAAGPPLVVADPTTDLPFARAEGRAIAARLGGAVSAIGPEATRERVLGALDGAAVFHFAGHGVLEPAQPWDAHLKLAGGEALSLTDIFVARPRLGVVVLSGCETGRTIALGRRERIGLADAFLAAGARAVLATRIPIRDDRAQSFIEDFYAAGGRDHPAAALRTAIRRAREAGNSIWRAFELVGHR